MTKDWPIAAVWVFFLFGALARGSALYWVGRGLRKADKRGLAERPSIRRAEQVITRWVATVVALSFLTVGVQSAVNIAAGILRMPLARFAPALLVGASIWATIYTTVGMSVFYAALGELSWGWVGAGVLAAALVVAVTAYARRRLRLRAPNES